MMKTREIAEELVGELFHGRFQVQEELGATGHTRVFLARDLPGSRDVSVKVVTRAGRGHRFESYLEFQRHAGALEGVSHPRVARLLAMEKTSTAVILVEEFFPGALLGELIPHLPLGQQMVVSILGQLAEALEPFHQAGLYHRHLTPQNVLLHGVSADQPPSETWQVDARVINFGHSLLADPSLTGDEPAADFAYTAPERVGMLPQLADGRADLYSMGVIAYHLLSGRLPFEGPSAGVYLHRVMATNPLPLRKLLDSLPVELDRLIESLIACTPEERPVSVGQVREELKRIGGKEGKGQYVGLASRILAVNAPELVEREAPLKRLRARLELAMRGEGSTVAVCGANGDGKTRLVEELRGPLEAAGGLFLRTQASEMERHLPFYAVRDIIDQHAAALREASGERRAEMSRKLQATLGSLGGGFLRLLPSLGQFLERPSEQAPLEPERERQRFVLALVQFFLAMGTARHPALIFFDDLHSADAESREVFERLSRRIGRTHLLLVASVRPGTDADRAITSAGARAGGEAGRPGSGREGSLLRTEGDGGQPVVERIQVEPLTLEGTTRLLRLVLQLDADSIEGISEFVFERARGNVRFTLEIARALAQDLEGSKPAALDRSQLNILVPAADAREIVFHRIDRLEAKDREVLELAALIGRKFPLALLLEICPHQEEQVRRSIQRGLMDQVVTPHAREEEDVLYFVDSAVQEQLYGGMDPGRRSALHERLGDILLADGAGEDRIFEAAYHYQRCGAPEKAARACIQAGDEARKAHANHQAARFYEDALLAAGRGGLEIDRSRILEGLGDACSLLGKYPDAEQSYRQTLDLGGDRLRLARLWAKIGDTYLGRGDTRQAVTNISRGLASLGIRLPRGTPGIFLSIFWQLLVLFLRSLIPRSWLIISREDKRSLAREAVKVLHSLAYASYFQDIVRTLDIHLRQLNLAERVGRSRELAQTYSDHGIVCSIIPLHRRAHAYQAAGLCMRRELGDEWGVGQSHGFLGICCYYRAEWVKALEHFRESIRILEKMGDQWEVEVVYIHSAFAHRMMGNLAAGFETLDALLGITKDTNDKKFEGFAHFGRAQALLQRGDLDQALEAVDQALAIEVDSFNRAIDFRAKAQILIRYGFFGEAMKAIEEGAEIIRRHHIRNDYVTENRVTMAEALIADTERILALGKRERKRRLRRVRPVVARAVRAARLFRNHLGYALRVRGIYHWLRGEPRRALADFARSRKVLARLGARYELARTQLEAGRWLARTGDARAIPFLDEAVQLFQELGARRDLEDARELRVHAGAGTWLSAGESRRGLRNEHRQLASLFKVSQSIASILELDRLLRRAVDLAIEVLGAERGFILLADREGEEPTVRVARDVSQRELGQEEYQLNTEVLRKVYAEQKPRVATEEIAPGPAGRAGQSHPLRSILCVPLRIKDRPLGLIYIDNRLVKDLYREPDVELLSTFAAQAAVAIENARAYRKIEELNIGLEEKVRERTGELLKAKMVLEKANLMKDEFLANMSHELRTPLNAVIALADILSEETFGPLNQKQQKYVGDIIQSGTHLLSLINDILDLSKIEAGQMQLQLSEFDLGSLLTESLVMVKEKASQRSISLSLDLDPDLPMVKADHRKIKQVVFNLLSNAVKFTEDGGRVVIRSRRGDGEAVVTVEDSGIGISRENLGKIFVEFQQIDTSFSRKYTGTGLGLALSKRFVELHKGRIWVESELRQGSRFSFTIPMGK